MTAGCLVARRAGERPPARPCLPGRLGRKTTENGSALLLVLLLCLGSALLVTSLAAVLLCCERAIADENEGRARLAEKDEVLSALAREAGEAWEAKSWSQISPGEGALDTVDGSQGWLMQALARQDPSVSHMTVSALVERGRDGLDLPLAAAVAASASTGAGRAVPWLEADVSGEQADHGAACYLLGATDSSLLGPGCAAGTISDKWRLDPGSLELLGATTSSAWVASQAGPSLHRGSGVVALEGRQGTTVRMPSGTGGGSAEEPVLVIVTGGATLDLTGLGELFGVAVADQGTILLDQTTLHGAAFATETLDMGATGRIVFSRSVLRWACDRSFVRTRLVPGTRKEGTQ
ncbi:MAG TPA: hypothetical protein VIL51_09335 [Thermoleophilia bacterium]